jgi:hypothetical protein
LLVQKEPENLAHQRDLGIALESVGRICEKQEDLGRAQELFAQSRGIRELLVKKEPENLAHQRELCIALLCAGRAARKAGKRDEAVNRLESAKALSEGLVARGWSRAGIKEHLQEIEEELRLARQT